MPELRAEALKASPPREHGPFRKPELVELIKLDPTIKLDIRYATTNDFLGTPLYTQARAFLAAAGGGGTSPRPSRADSSGIRADYP